MWQNMSAQIKASPRLITFIVIMSAVANALGFLSVSAGMFRVHFIQIPIILTGLALGPLAGGFVGFTGAIVMAFMLITPNPYLLFGNAILGGLTGLFYRYLRRVSGIPLIPQMLAVLGAYTVQMPYVYVTDVYLMSMPVPVVLMIMLTLLIEDVISVLIVHPILYRVKIPEILR